MKNGSKKYIFHFGATHKKPHEATNEIYKNKLFVWRVTLEINKIK